MSFLFRTFSSRSSNSSSRSQDFPESSRNNELKKDKQVVNEEEHEIENVQKFLKDLNDWQLPKIEQDKIYKKSNFIKDLTRTDYSVKITKKDLSLTSSHQTIQLLNNDSLQTRKKEGFSNIVTSCCKIVITYCFKHFNINGS